MKYKHLTLEQRYHISALKKAGFSQKEIAVDLKVSEATISRELKRNSSTQMKSYSANNAHKVSTARRMYASRKSNKKMDGKLKQTLANYLLQDWSPE